MKAIFLVIVGVGVKDIAAFGKYYEKNLPLMMTSFSKLFGEVTDTFSYISQSKIKRALQCIALMINVWQLLGLVRANIKPHQSVRGGFEITAPSKITVSNL